MCTDCARLCVQIACDVLNKLPAEFELDKIRKKYGLEISPTTVVLLQELERFNLLITRMRLSLATLQRVSTSSLSLTVLFFTGFTNRHNYLLDHLYLIHQLEPSKDPTA